MTLVTQANSILSRRSFADSSPATALQSQVDGLVSHFVEEAANPTTLAAMVAGGFAYRLGRVGVLSSFVGASGGTPVRTASVLIGLGSEVTAFEFTNRVLQSVRATGQSPLQNQSPVTNHRSPNLWSWSGTGGWREGLFHSFLTFGILKGAGHLAREENVVLQHVFQSGAMVAGHQTAHLFGLAPRPEGSLAERFLHAEATNLQLGAGMGLVHAVAPGIFALERGLDLTLSSQAAFPRRFADPSSLLRPQEAVEGGSSSRALGGNTPVTNVFMMGVPREERPSSPPPSDRRPPPIAIELNRKALVPLLIPLLKELPSHRRCLLLEVPFDSLPRSTQIPRMLENHPYLMEIRVHFSDGKVTWFLKNEGRVESESEEAGFAKLDREEAIYTPREIQRVHFYTAWRPPSQVEAIAPFLSRLRKASGLSQQEICERLDEEGVRLTPGTLSQYERGAARGPSFEVLRGLAKIYRVDLRELIESANRSRFPDLPADWWSTSHYPIFIEDAVDVRRLHSFHEKTNGRKTVGWLLFAARKNPFQYLVRPELADRAGVARSSYDLMEDNKASLGPLSLTALSRLLRMEPSDLIHANNFTFYRKMIPRLERLFPGKAIYLDSHEDPERLALYEREPHSIGKILFEFRKGLPGLPSASELSKQLGFHDTHWFLRESNRVPVRANNLNEWMDLLQKADIPLSHLDPFVSRAEVDKESPRYLISQAMEGRSSTAVSRESGLHEQTILNLLNLSDDSRRIDSETLWILKQALPSLDGARLLRGLRPQTLQFFPELGGDDPSIRISSSQIEEALTLNVGERIFALRMDQSLEKLEIARQLGVTPRVVDLYESQVSQPKDDATLLNLAHVLGIDPKVVYLHYHPEVLGLAPVRDEAGDPLGAVDVRELKRARIVRDASGLRATLWRLARERGLETTEDLGAYLGLVSPAQMKRLAHLHDNLGLQDLRFLKERFPELPLRAFYNHYHFSILSYFLGKNEDGSLDFEMPEGFSWRGLQRLNLSELIRESLDARGLSLREVVRRGLTEIGNLPSFVQRLEEGRIKDETLARASRIVVLDRRLLYFYVYRRELRAVLKEPQ